MKKFEFSLSKLMEYKKQVLKKEKNQLSDYRKTLTELEDKKTKAVLERSLKNSELISRINDGLSSQHIAFHKHYIQSISDDIRELENRILLEKARIEAQLKVVIGATQEVDSLEKLESKQLEEYKKQEAKENELFIEEFVSHTTNYGA